MLASWALVHPPWIPTLHLPLRWGVVSRSVSQSKASTSRPRYPSSKQPAGLSRRSHASHPSPDRLATLSAQGNYQLIEKLRIDLSELGVEIPGDGISAQEFSKWLARLPDAHSPDQDRFHGMRQFLQTSSEANLPLIIQFGIACASKGYTTIVEKDILPIVFRLADTSTYEQFVKDTKFHSRDYYKRSDLQNTIPPEAVFEDATEDYNIVNSEALPPPPNVLNLIADNLPRVLPQPLPNDTLVFEDESDYDYISYTSPSLPTSLPDVLAQLVSDHQYEEAYSFFLEVQEVGGVPVPNSFIYEQAARAALDSKLALTPEERLKRFTSWISLIPPAHSIRSPVQFLEIRRLIFRAPYPNYILAARFATALASKGYGDFIIPHAVPIIMRFAPGDASHRFILDFEQANEAYWTEYKPNEARLRIANTKRNLREAAVKYLTYSDRLETAISLLPKEGDPFQFKPRIYDDLIRGLRRLRASAKHVSAIETLKQAAEVTVAGCSRVGGKSVDEDLHDKFSDLSPKNFGQDIGRAVLYLRKALASRNNLPDPLTLSQWFELYTLSNSKRKRRAITTLRNKALQCGGRSAETYLFAEMHYYLRMGNDDLVIKTFADHFYLIGVPQEDILAHYYRVKQDLAVKYRMEESLVDAQLQQYTPTQSERLFGEEGESNNQSSVKLGRRKLWPKHSHTTLVWHALLNLTSSDADVDNLYQKLVEISVAESDTSVDSVNSSLLSPLSRTRNVGGAAFTPFIRKLMVTFGASRGATVLNDMLKIGFEPTLHQFTELAGIYARLGDATRAFMILDRMEANNLKPVADLNEQNTPPAPSSLSQVPSVEPIFPAPDVALYTSLLRGFLIARDLRAINEVDHRLKKRHGYIPGVHPALDEVYDDVARLRTELGETALNDVD